MANDYCDFSAYYSLLRSYKPMHEYTEEEMTNYLRCEHIEEDMRESARQDREETKTEEEL